MRVVVIYTLLNYNYRSLWQMQDPTYAQSPRCIRPHVEVLIAGLTVLKRQSDSGLGERAAFLSSRSSCTPPSFRK
jgi:hypothetical protein